jgi:hypothetical protein
MFARAIGPFLVIVPATAAARASDMRALVSDFAANALWPWVIGTFVLLAGLVVVALHQYWGSPAAVIVSVVGWLVALKGLLLMAFPATYMSAVSSAVGAVTWWRTGVVVLVVIGLYLSVIGWAPARHRAASRVASSTPDLPRAA